MRRTTKRPRSLQRSSLHMRHCRGLLLWMENFCDKIRNHQQNLWSKQGVDYIWLPRLHEYSTKNVSSDVKAISRPQRGARGNWNYGWNSQPPVFTALGRIKTILTQQDKMFFDYETAWSYITLWHPLYLRSAILYFTISSSWVSSLKQVFEQLIQNDYWNENSTNYGFGNALFSFLSVPLPLQLNAAPKLRQRQNLSVKGWIPFITGCSPDISQLTHIMYENLVFWSKFIFTISNSKKTWRIDNYLIY